MRSVIFSIAALLTVQPATALYFNDDDPMVFRSPPLPPGQTDLPETISQTITQSVTCRTGVNNIRNRTIDRTGPGSIFDEIMTPQTIDMATFIAKVLYESNEVVSPPHDCNVTTTTVNGTSQAQHGNLIRILAGGQTVRPTKLMPNRHRLDAYPIAVMWGLTWPQFGNEESTEQQVRVLGYSDRFANWQLCRIEVVVLGGESNEEVMEGPVTDLPVRCQC